MYSASCRPKIRQDRWLTLSSSSSPWKSSKSLRICWLLLLSCRPVSSRREPSCSWLRKSDLARRKNTVAKKEVSDIDHVNESSAVINLWFSPFRNEGGHSDWRRAQCMDVVSILLFRYTGIFHLVSCFPHLLLPQLEAATVSWLFNYRPFWHFSRRRHCHARLRCPTLPRGIVSQFYFLKLILFQSYFVAINRSYKVRWSLTACALFPEFFACCHATIKNRSAWPRP